MNLHIIERVLRACDPAIADVPIYLVDEMEVVTTHHPRAIAWTSAFLDLELADQLQEQGRWQGEGFCSVFCLERMPARFHQWVGVFLHELSHWYNHPVRVKHEVKPELLSVALRVAFEGMDRTSADAANPRLHHGIDFVRAACHLAYRVENVMESVRPHHLSFGRKYYGIPELTFMRWLEPELEAMRDRPIREVLASEPPDDFVVKFSEIAQ